MKVVPKGRRSRIGFAATLTALAAVLVFAFAAATAPLPGSNFEIDDGNLIVNGTAPPALDWANVNEQRKADTLDPILGDNSFTQGTKEDTAVPVVEFGSIPPNKSDLLNMGFYLEENAAGRFLNLFWHRVQEPNGTTNMDFEFNKSSVLSANNVTPVRTEGDVLIQYDLSRGGVSPTIWLSSWLTTGDPALCEENGPLPCWSDKANLTAAGVAAGSINLVPISAANSDGLGPISARTFGEAQVDLSALTEGEGGCSVFGSAYLKSRSSDSFTSALKDFIPPLVLDIDQCAKVVIRKVTDPVSDPAEVQFGYTKNINTDPDTANTFTLGHGQNQTYDAVEFGTGYTVVEDVEEDGWDFQSLDCSASVGVTPTIVGAQVTFNIDNKDDVLDCTYTNRARGTIIVEKITDDGFGAFDFTSNSLPPQPFALTLTTTAAGAAGADSETYSNLNPGAYDVSETVPAGWNLVSESCSDGDDPQAISLAAGQTITCTFHNARERGAILIQKTRKHQADGPGDHPHAEVDFTVTGGELPAGGVPAETGTDGTVCVGNLVLSSHVGPYTVTESVPAGYVVVGPGTQNVAVTQEGSCPSGPFATVSFANMPLTDVTITVDSQVVGGTATVIDCGANGTASTGPGGDGSLSIPNKQPSVVVCEITIDP